jgi:hypothetical protein
MSEREPEYQEPDITPDFYADTNDMYLPYQQAEADPGAEGLAEITGRQSRPEPEPEAEPEAEIG